MKPVDGNKPKRRTKAEREAWVKRWRESGRSVPAFAAEHGLASSSLYQCINPPRSAERKKRKTRPSKAAFTEVKVTNAVPVSRRAGSSVTITLRSGHAVTVAETARVDPSWLAQVVKAVSGC